MSRELEQVEELGGEEEEATLGEAAAGCWRQLQPLEDQETHGVTLTLRSWEG